MSLKDDTTAENCKEETYKEDLFDELINQLGPLKAFYALIDGFACESSLETQNIWLVLGPLLDQFQGKLEKIGEVVSRTIGEIQIEAPCHGEFVKFDGESFSYGEYIRAILEPKETASTIPQGGAA